MRRFMERYEFFVLPTVQVGAVQHRYTPYPTEIDERGDADVHRLDEVVLLHLHRGNPAISVPCGLYARGLTGRSSDRRSVTATNWGLLQIAHASKAPRTRSAEAGHFTERLTPARGSVAVSRRPA